MSESEDLERLRAACIPTGAYRVEETPPELAKILIAFLDRIIDDESNADNC